MLIPGAGKVEGRFIIEIIRGDTGKREVYSFANRVVAQGRDYMLRNTIGVNTVNINYLFVSNSNTTVSDSETSVPGTWKTYKTATKSASPSDNPAYAQWSATFSGSDVGGQTVYSYALATGTDGSGEFSRILHSAGITFGSNDTLNVTYQVQITAAN